MVTVKAQSPTKSTSILMTYDLKLSQLITMMTDTADVTASKFTLACKCEIQRFGEEDCVANKHITKLRE